MSYASYNPNPAGRSIGDCAIRAIAKAVGLDWDTAYIALVALGLERKDLPNADSIWGAYLRRHGFTRRMIGDEYPDGYTVSEFAADHPEGVYVLSMPGRHVVTVSDGAYYDSWDSGAEVPVYYYEREEAKA